MYIRANKYYQKYCISSKGIHSLLKYILVGISIRGLILWLIVHEELYVIELFILLQRNVSAIILLVFNYVYKMFSLQ